MHCAVKVSDCALLSLEGVKRERRLLNTMAIKNTKHVYHMLTSLCQSYHGLSANVFYYMYLTLREYDKGARLCSMTV